MQTFCQKFQNIWSPTDIGIGTVWKKNKKQIYAQALYSEFSLAKNIDLGLILNNVKNAIKIN